MRRIVSAYLLSFPTDRLRRNEQAGWPVDQPLVTKKHDGRRFTIQATDRAARQAGLKPGMALAHAHAMLPGLLAVPEAPEADWDALSGLAWRCLQFAPLTCVAAPDGLWIDTTGCAHLYGGEAPMLHKMRDAIRSCGYAVRLAIADTAGAAHALARYAADETAIALPGQHRVAIGGFPVSALRLPLAVCVGLDRLGLETVAQLAAIPRAPIARRFGTEIIERLDQAWGLVAEAIPYAIPPEIPQERCMLTEPLITAEALSYVMALLVETLCRRLEGGGTGVRQLDLIFERVDRSIQAVRIGTAKPTRDIKALIRLLHERLPTVDPGFGVEAMQLVASSTEPLAHQQSAISLVDDNEADLAPLIDRLANRFGAERIYRLERQESDVPERAVMPISPVSRVSARTVDPITLMRPVRLLDPPQSVRVVAEWPDRPPAAFFWRSVRHYVCLANGPERIYGEWWQRDKEISAVRDYWQVEDQTGARFWLFRRGDGVDEDTGDLDWFLHGFFA